QLPQTLGDGLHLDVDRARLGNLGAFDLQLLNALHHFAQRPEHQVRRQDGDQQTQSGDDRSEDAAQFDRRRQVFAETRGGNTRDQRGERLITEVERLLHLIDVVVAPQVPQLAVPARRFELAHGYDPAVRLPGGL